MNSLKSNLTATPITEAGIYSHRRYIDTCQRLARRVGGTIGLLMMRKRNITLTPSDIEPEMRYVVVANHQTYLDPWMVLSRIPMTIWKKIGMPRALVANRFFRYPVVGNYLRSMGSFPAKTHPTDPFGLDYAAYLLDHGQSIVIFPEGHITLTRNNPARHGVLVLAQLPNVRIIPMHLEWKRPRIRANFDIGIGKPFDGSKMTAQEILDKVYSVPVK